MQKKHQSLSLSEFSLYSFPSTKFMGSKQALLPFIDEVVSYIEAKIPFTTVLDAFSGSACVSFLFKTKGKQVTANDFLKFCYHTAKATIENPSVCLSKNDIETLLKQNKNKDNFIERTFKGLYYLDSDNRFLDNVYANIKEFRNPYKKSLALAALCRACAKKRPRGIFTYTGYRYDDGRRDLRLSMEEQLITAVGVLNDCVFDNGQGNEAMNLDVFKIEDGDFDLVYIDPPYFTPHSDNDYTRRYHFLEGLCSYWKNAKIQFHTRTKKIKPYPTPFTQRAQIYDAFNQLFGKFKHSILLVSYSSNSIPTKEEMIKILKKYRQHVEVFENQHTYSFANQRYKVGSNKNRVFEYLFVGY